MNEDEALDAICDAVSPRFFELARAAVCAPRSPASAVAGLITAGFAEGLMAARLYPEWAMAWARALPCTPETAARISAIVADMPIGEVTG